MLRNKAPYGSKHLAPLASDLQTSWNRVTNLTMCFTGSEPVSFLLTKGILTHLFDLKT